MTPPREEMYSRWEKLRAGMRRQQLKGLLVFSSQIKPEPIHYLTNYTLIGEKAFCLLPPNEDPPVLYISAAWDCARAEKEARGVDVRIIGKDLHRELAALINKYGMPVGMCGEENLPRLDRAALEAELGAEPASGTRLLEDAAAIKSTYELALIREASRMADAGFNSAIAAAREGMADFELGAEIDYAVRNMGATDNFQMLAVGKGNTGMHLPYGKKLEPGDLLLFEISPAFGSITYSAQLCKTAVLGRISSLIEDKYAVLIEALEASLKIIKPGVEMGEVTRVQDEIIGRAGYGEFCRPPYMQQRGHGFGLGAIKIKADVTRKFEAGMSCVVHPNQFIPETGYLALGEHVIVTSEGIERLTLLEPNIYECA